MPYANKANPNFNEDKFIEHQDPFSCLLREVLIQFLGRNDTLKLSKATIGKEGSLNLDLFSTIDTSVAFDKKHKG